MNSKQTKRIEVILELIEETQAKLTRQVQLLAKEAQKLQAHEDWINAKLRKDLELRNIVAIEESSK